MLLLVKNFGIPYIKRVGKINFACVLICLLQDRRYYKIYLDFLQNIPGATIQRDLIYERPIGLVKGLDQIEKIGFNLA